MTRAGWAIRLREIVKSGGIAIITTRDPAWGADRLAPLIGEKCVSIDGLCSADHAWQAAPDPDQDDRRRRRQGRHHHHRPVHGQSDTAMSPSPMPAQVTVWRHV